MLKVFRVFVALIIFAALSVLFLDFTDAAPKQLHWFAHLQFVPAVKMKMVGVLLFWIIATLLFGRLYCSFACPFGILQDGIAYLAKCIRRKKAAYRFRPEMYKTRRLILLLFVIGLAAVPAVVSQLDPYSIYGRTMALLVRPVLMSGNNLLASAMPDRFRFYAVHLAAVPVCIALFVALIAAVLSFFFGRRYCNVICPVGTLLGLFAKVAPFRVFLNDKCLSCGLCEKVCKGECIDSKAKTTDVSRCVGCFNCLKVCKKHAISYQANYKAITERSGVSHQKIECSATKLGNDRRPRRSFIQGAFAALLASPGCSASKHEEDTGLPTGESRVSYKKTHPVLPPGAKSRGHLIHHCTACQLCVAKCPSNVLVPSITDLGFRGFLVPVAKFDHGFCQYDCKICSEVCPTAALIPIASEEEKHKLQIGRVVFLKENCVVNTQNTNCGACAEHCPTNAITMIAYEPPGGASDLALTIPEVNPDLCVGCGACEKICPVKPYRAIYADGLEKHGEALPAFDPNEKQQEIKLDSFGF